MPAEDNGEGSTPADNGRRAEPPSEARTRTWGWSSQQRSFDDLARGLANGTISRRHALWLLGSALVGGWLVLTSGRRGFAQTEEIPCSRQDPSNCPAGWACCPDPTPITGPKGEVKGEQFICTPPGPDLENAGCSCPSNQELCKGACHDVTCEDPGQFFSRQTCQCEAGVEGTCAPLASGPDCCDPNNPPTECCCPGQINFEQCRKPVDLGGEGKPRCSCCFLPCEGLSEGVSCNCVPTLEPGEQTGEVVRVTRCVAGDRNNCSAQECSTSLECRPGQVCVELTDPRFGCGCNKNICVPLCGITPGGTALPKS